MRAILVAGSPEAERPVGVVPSADDLVIAVDRGALHARAWGWPVDLLVGDFDSLPAGDVERERASGTKIIRAPVAKDETDLELGIARAIDAGVTELLICGALGGRTDHLLANLLQLCRADLAAMTMRIVDGRQCIRLLRGNENANETSALELTGTSGDLLSLAPIGGDAIGVTTDGLAYPLRDEDLPFGGARGISNQFVGTKARVILRQGMLLVIHAAVDVPSVQELHEKREGE